MVVYLNGDPFSVDDTEYLERFMNAAHTKDSDPDSWVRFTEWIETHGAALHVEPTQEEK